MEINYYKDGDEHFSSASPFQILFCAEQAKINDTRIDNVIKTHNKIDGIVRNSMSMNDLEIALSTSQFTVFCRRIYNVYAPFQADLNITMANFMSER